MYIYYTIYTYIIFNIGRHGADDRELKEFIYIGFSEGGWLTGSGGRTDGGGGRRRRRRRTAAGGGKLRHCVFTPPLRVHSATAGLELPSATHQHAPVTEVLALECDTCVIGFQHSHPGKFFRCCSWGFHDEVHPRRYLPHRCREGIEVPRGLAALFLWRRLSWFGWFKIKSPECNSGVDLDGNPPPEVGKSMQKSCF